MEVHKDKVKTLLLKLLQSELSVLSMGDNNSPSGKEFICDKEVDLVVFMTSSPRAPAGRGSRWRRWTRSPRSPTSAIRRADAARHRAQVGARLARVGHAAVHRLHDAGVVRQGDARVAQLRRQLAHVAAVGEAALAAVAPGHEEDGGKEQRQSRHQASGPGTRSLTGRRGPRSTCARPRGRNAAATVTAR